MNEKFKIGDNWVEPQKSNKVHFAQHFAVIKTQSKQSVMCHTLTYIIIQTHSITPLRGSTSSLSTFKTIVRLEKLFNKFKKFLKAR